MSALARLFPGAMERPWENCVAVVRVFDPDTKTLTLWQKSDNGAAARHAVNTYDARDEALREAEKALRHIAEEPLGPSDATWKEALEIAEQVAHEALGKVRSALAVRP